MRLGGVGVERPVGGLVDDYARAGSPDLREQARSPKAVTRDVSGIAAVLLPAATPPAARPPTNATVQARSVRLLARDVPLLRRDDVHDAAHRSDPTAQRIGSLGDRLAGPSVGSG